MKIVDVSFREQHLSSSDHWSQWFQLKQRTKQRVSIRKMNLGLDISQVVKVIDLSALVDPLSRLQYLAVDYAKDGQVYVYVTDAASKSIIVYNLTADKGYRVVLPSAVTAGVERRDVLYLTLVKKSCGTSILYFTYLGSNKLFAIKAENLRKGYTQGAVVDVGPKRNKIVLLGTDNGCAIFFRVKGNLASCINKLT